MFFQKKAVPQFQCYEREDFFREVAIALMFGHQSFDLTSLKISSLQCAVVKQDVVHPLFQFRPEPTCVGYREARLFSMQDLSGDPAAKRLLEKVFCCETMHLEMTG